jgi:hypothetical protein
MAVEKLSDKKVQSPLDLYEMLYWFRSRKGHRRSVVSENIGIFAGISAKTVQRRSDKSKHALNIPFWRQYGFLSDEDWEYFQTSNIKNMLPELDIFGLIAAEAIPEHFRKVSPDYVEFVWNIWLFQQGFAKINDGPPLLKDAVDFIITTAIHISEIVFALINKNSDEYEASVNRLRLPIPFPKEQVWEEYVSEGKAEKSCKKFFEELLLLGVLCFDIAFVTWAVSEPDEYIKDGKAASALMGALNELSKDESEPFRERFFQNVRKAVRKKRPEVNSNEKLYLALASAKGMKKEKDTDTIKKQCTSIRKGEFPTPKVLTDFLKRVSSIILDGNVLDNNAREIFYHRHLFAHYFIVEEILCSYVSTQKYASCSDLFAKLLEYKEWLHQEIFHCPFPAYLGWGGAIRALALAGTPASLVIGVHLV